MIMQLSSENITPYPRPRLNWEWVDFREFETTGYVRLFFFKFEEVFLVTNKNDSSHILCPRVGQSFKEDILRKIVRKVKEVVESYIILNQLTCSINAVETIFKSQELSHYNVLNMKYTKKALQVTAETVAYVVERGGVFCTWNQENPAIWNLAWKDKNLFKQDLVRNPYQAEELIKGLDTFRLNRELTDFELLVDGHSIPVHRVILALASPNYFAPLFRSNTVEIKTGKLPIRDCDRDMVELAVEFIYTGEILIRNPSLEIYLKLLDFAQNYQVDQLALRCSNSLEPFIDNDNVVSLCAHAIRNNNKHLKWACEMYSSKAVHEKELQALQFDLSPFPFSDKDTLIEVGNYLGLPNLVAAAQAMK